MLARWLAVLICATSVQADCVSVDEQHLFALINNYRAAHRLARIPLSALLTLVARTHVRDLAANHPDRGACNLHSWSRKGGWTPCCYTSNHRAAQCMWEKPREIAGYSSDGYEIASEAWPAGPAEEHMEGWKSSEAHNAVMLNRGTWADKRWQAMGVGIFEGYAVVWFGTQPDTKRGPEPCKGP
jgi:Cysteine-rich secretory protein family